jgi:tRNA (guanine37-N1)-methyltransferase
VDDTPYGGGPGMVLRADIVYYCVEEIKKNIEKRRGEFNSKRAKIILFSAKGSKYNQKKALEWSKNLKDLILICGRYEGVDERVAKFIADEEISIGEYVLSGGEIPAMAAVDSVSRLLPGVLGNKESLCIESYNPKNKTFETDFPVYTKPEKFNNWRVPKVLLSGNHQRIENWRRGKQVRKDKNTN